MATCNYHIIQISRVTIMFVHGVTALFHYFLLFLSLQRLVNIISPKPAVRHEIMVPTDDCTLQAPEHCSETITLSSPCSGNQSPAPIHCLHLSYNKRKVMYSAYASFCYILLVACKWNEI